MSNEYRPGTIEFRQGDAYYRFCPRYVCGEWHSIVTQRLCTMCNGNGVILLGFHCRSCDMAWEHKHEFIEHMRHAHSVMYVERLKRQKIGAIQ